MFVDGLERLVVHFVVCARELLFALAGWGSCVVGFGVVRETGGLPAKPMDNLVKPILLPLAAHCLFPFPDCMILEGFQRQRLGT